jgi:fatty acid desaturase
MKLYREEIQGAEEHWRGKRFPLLRFHQLAYLEAEAASLRAKVVSSPRTHNIIGLFTILLLFALDSAALFLLPYLLGTGLWAALAVVFLHGYLLYGISVYSVHEGAGHGGIVRYGPFRGAERFFWRILHILATEAGRLVFTDTQYYRSVHPSHHAYLGTEKDRAFTHFVARWRFFLSLVPLAGVLPFSDYKIHDPGKWTRSKILSTILGALYFTYCIALLSARFPLGASLLIGLLLAPWLGFVLDRLRETTEHHLMPREASSGARNLGLGFWGLLIGGGPWGQPCHLSHHLAPSLPWYFQLALHRRLVKILTPRQKKFFLVKSFPALLLSLLKRNARLESRARWRDRLLALRVADAATLTQVQALRREVYSDFGKSAAEEDPIDNPNYHLYAFFRREKLVGSIALHFPGQSFLFVPEKGHASLAARARPGDCMEVGRFFLREEARDLPALATVYRTGYGEFRASGRREMIACCDSSIRRLYLRMGFRDTALEFTKQQLFGGQTMHILHGRYRHLGIYCLKQGPLRWILFARSVENRLRREGRIFYRRRERIVYRAFGAFIPLVKAFSRIPLEGET